MEERYYINEKQIIDLKDFNREGRVLDIGGGGEGVIGRILKEQAIAIDTRVDELEEAADGPLKIVMDGKDLKFLDKSFHTVTSFFTLLYIDKKYHREVFKEIYRVLKSDGEFIIWDINIPKYDGGVKDLFIIPLQIDIGDEKIDTSYGIPLENSEQNMEYYIELAEDIGFNIVLKEDEEVFKIILKK